MIGDLILKMKKILRQTFCIHDYNVKTRDVAFQSFNIYTCKKCGRIKSRNLGLKYRNSMIWKE